MKIAKAIQQMSLEKGKDLDEVCNPILSQAAAATQGIDESVISLLNMCVLKKFKMGVRFLVEECHLKPESEH